MQLIVSERAKMDIDSIWLFTYDRWSKEQADRYITLIEKAVLTIQENPNIGSRNVGSRFKGYRYIVESHTLYYTVQPNSINIQRILHQSMNTDNHL